MYAFASLSLAYGLVTEGRGRESTRQQLIGCKIELSGVELREMSGDFGHEDGNVRYDKARYDKARYDGMQDLGPNTAVEDHYVKGGISNI
jgi:hypothetical protein